MLLIATWRVTYGSLVLLDTEDLMPSEPRITPVGRTQTSMPLRAAYARHWPRGNVATTVNFGCIRAFDSDAEARNFVATHAAALSALMAATEVMRDLRIDLLDGGTVRVRNAVLSGPMECTSENHRFLGNYTFLGGQVIHQPADVEIIGDDDESAIVDDDGSLFET